MSSYDLKSIKLPRLAGGALRAFAEALENPLGASLLLGKLLDDGGINKLRRTVIDDSPTYYPIHFADSKGTPPPDLLNVPHPPTQQPNGFRFATTHDYHNAFRDRKTTPEAVGEKLIEAIKASKHLNTFIVYSADDVMRQAKESSGRWRDGKPLSIFDGVPVVIKDEVDQVPFPTSVGTKFLGTRAAAQDSTAVARLRAAGALLVGKANMHEIGINPVGFNAHYGTTRNPYNTAHYTGGSSSGPATAAASGLCPVALGADGGGSIRIPAALCGLVGLKSTFGRISEAGAYPLGWSVGHLGPLAATAVDAALMYAVIAAPDPRDPNTQHQPAATLADFGNMDLRGLTFGIYREWFNHASPEIVAACDSTVRKFVERGAQVREIEIPDLDLTRIAHVIAILSEMATSLEPFYAQHRRDYGLDVRVNLVIGRAFTSRDYVQAQRIRTRAMRNFNEALSKVDVILTPATAVTAPPIPADAVAEGESDLSIVTELMRFIFATNLTGHPSISFPVGYDSKGLPIGMQATGRAWHEHALLRLANVADTVVEKKRPQAYFPIIED
jgi:Asp-tRNA(Asn)/Glu-tRNA(Gln) amidotransferase A subunit family amidase